MGLFTKKEKTFDLNKVELAVGQLMDRPVYVYLPLNQRQVKLLNTFQILTQKKYEQVIQFEKVFSTQPGIDSKYPKLEESVNRVRRLFDVDDIPPYEKHLQICEQTNWLVSFVLDQEQKSILPLVFTHRVFGVPALQTLESSYEASVETYEKNIKTALLSGCIAMWLGYLHYTYLQEFIDAVFLGKEKFAVAELGQIVRFSRWIFGYDFYPLTEVQQNRAIAKLLLQFKLKFEKQFKETRVMAA